MERKVPLSLEELRQRKAANDGSAKPVFMSAEARKVAAIARLAERRARERAVRKVERVGAASEVDEAEREAIRKRYMKVADVGVRKKKGRGERFNPKWDETEDTGVAPGGVALQFGRGRRGGMGELGVSRERKRDSRHWSEKRREEMNDRDWRIFREDYVISVRGASGAPHPARFWSETGLPGNMLRLVTNVARYDKPSPIQMASIPIALQHRDLIGLAETGSGKTAAFVLPMCVHITQMPPMTPQIACRGPYALVLAPTRELVLQIEAEARKFAEPMGFRVVAVIGGQSLDEQATLLQAGCEIVICTPGRMVDLLGRQMAALGNCNYLILDEADRMVDMGFEPQVAEILGAMPEPSGEGVKRQTFMFSATMSPAIERLARTYLSQPMIVAVGETGQAADNVIQRVEFLESEGRKRERLLDLLRTLPPPVLVFVNTKGGCETVSRFVESGCGIRPVVMHSGKSQDQREMYLSGFRSGRFGVLIGTDVLGRGIDIKGVRHVINYELPSTIEAYTHRIGRTGRAGEKGTAWSLATSGDADIFPALRNLLEKAGAQIPGQLKGEFGGRNGKGFRAITD